jgi:hypothetical protein
MIRRTHVTAAIVVLMLVATAQPAAAQITPVRVLGGAASQFFPFRNDAWLAYTANSNETPNHWNALALDLSSKTVRKLNAGGTQGFTGGFDPRTNKVIYQQVDHNTSNVLFFDLDSQTRTRVPGVNTRAWEWEPRVSSAYLSFFRDYYNSGRWYTGVFSLRRSNGNVRRIASYKSSAYINNGSLGDRYASWTVCNRQTCFAYLYDLQSRSLKRLQSKNGRPQYAPVVDETNGLVFFVRSGFGCGLKVGFFFLPLNALGSDPTKIASLAAGLDVDNLASLAPNPDTGMQDLLFTRLVCNGSSDIYELPNASP